MLWKGPMTGMHMVHLGLEQIVRIGQHFAVRGIHSTPFERGGVAEQWLWS